MGKGKGKKGASKGGMGKRLLVSPARLISGVDSIVTISGKALINISAPPYGSTAPVAIPLNNTLSQRLTTMEGIYQEFRFVETVIKLHQGTQNYVCGFFKTALAASTVTPQNLYDAENSRFVDATETIPMTMVLTRSDFANVRPWYQTTATGSSDDPDSVQGTFYFGSAVSNVDSVFWVEIGYVVQFRGAVNSAA